MYRDSERWMKLRLEQPVLFPARRSQQGTRYAKDLEKFLKSTVNLFASTQQARRLLDEYANTRR